MTHRNVRIEDGTVRTPLWRLVSELARQQHGVVALWQLTDLGISASAVRNRVAAGLLHRVHRGVYAVGHSRLTQKGRFVAAVLALGRSAALSHRSAAALIDLRADDRVTIDVTVSNRRIRSRAGLDVHQASLLTRDVTTIDGIACTAWPRTLLDLAAELHEDAVEAAIERTEVLRLYDRQALLDVLERNPTHRGAATLHSLIEIRADAPAPSRSELERSFLRLCRSASLPSPIANAQVHLPDGVLEVDFFWPEHRLIAETDGRETHDTATAFERDRRRDQRLALAGYRVVRFTWRQVAYEPAGVVATLAGLLEA